ncbi:MAG: LysR family transcriptional regulator [Clostridia bacterium]|nr:LysR family transcriptional regulator [Clostridia bacterium]
MDLLQLTYFCHAAKTENFSKTAEHFFVPVSNISQTIKRLEKELGTRLFHREANKIKLNALGRAFYANVSRAFALLEEGKRVVENTRNDNTGNIKILVHTCRRIVTQTIENFKIDFPNVNFIIHHTKDGTGGDYDFIISDRPFSSRLSHKSLLLSESIMLACHKKHKLANVLSITANDLRNEDFISMSAGNSLHSVLMEISTCENFAPKIAIQSDDPFYVRKYVDEKLGLAFIPAVSWQGSFSENTLLKPFGNYRRNTFVFYDDPQFMPNIQKLFLSYLKQVFQQETPPTV